MRTKMYTQEGCQLKRLRRRLASAGRPHLTQYGGSAASREAISRLPRAQAPWGIAKFGEFIGITPDNTGKRIYPRIADGSESPIRLKIQNVQTGIACGDRYGGLAWRDKL